jgi:phosphatidylglycerol---prolipoprotein diacylglyceryl transferase
MHPVLFRLGPVIIYTHDFFTTLGLLAGLALYYYELRRREMLSWQIVVISVAAILGGGIGARTITAWEHLAYYSNNAGAPLSYLIAHSGKSIIGGIAGGYLAIAIGKRALRYRHSTGDCYAAAIPLALVIGRIGCFLAELPLGTPTNLPWGVRASEAAASHFASCPSCQQKMHPSMVYEIIFHAIALVAIVRYRQHVMVQGDTLKIYLLVAAIFRFLVEFVRANPEQVGGLSGPQIVLIPLTALLVWHFVRNWRRGLYRMPQAPLAANASAVALAPAPARRAVGARRFGANDA